MASTLTLGVTLEITTGSADVLTELVLPENARSVAMQPRVNPAKIVEVGGTDAGAIGTTDYVLHPAGTRASYPVPYSRGRARNMDATTRKMWITSAFAGTVIEVTAYAAPIGEGA